jgi:hypothetical protein
MNRRLAPVSVAALALLSTAAHPETPADPLDEAERQEQADLKRLRAVNTGAPEFLNAPAETTELHTRTFLTLDDASLRDGWVVMRQCQSGLDGMQRSEIVYRYAGMRALRIADSRGIGEAWVDGQSVQLRGVEAGAEICMSADVKLLRALGDGRYRIVSGPYHRRFFDGYFPLRLSLEVTFPAERLQWTRISPEPRPGFALSAAPGRLAIDTRFAGMLSVELEFVQPGYATPQPPSPQ